VHSAFASLLKLRTRLTGGLRAFAFPGAGSALRGVSFAFRPVLLSISILGWTGCSKITMLRTQELRKVEDDVKATGKQIETLQKSVDELNLAQGGSTSKMKADLTLMLNQLESQITRLHAEIDETQYRLTQLSAKIDKLDQKKIIVGSGAAQSATGTPAGTPGAAATPGTATPGTETRVVEGLDLEAMFNQARDDYIRGKYELAMTGFKTVYEKDAGGTWRELAMFWMGETLMKQDKPDKALEAYGRVVKEFPRGTKSCSARFKSGLIYNQKKEKAKRDEEWAALIKECPGTNEAQRAQELQKE
jgi:TolA-binding protein